MAASAAPGSVQAGKMRVTPIPAELRDWSEWRRPKCAKAGRTITDVNVNGRAYFRVRDGGRGLGGKVEMLEN